MIAHALLELALYLALLCPMRRLAHAALNMTWRGACAGSPSAPERPA